MPRTKWGHKKAPSGHRFWRRGGGEGALARSPCPNDPAARQTRKPPSITEGTPKPHVAQSIFGKSTSAVADDEPSRKAMGCRRTPTAVRAGFSQHGRGRVGMDKDEPSRKAMGCRKAPTAVRAGFSQHGRGRVGMDKDEPSRKALGCRRTPTAVRAGFSQHGRGRVGMDWGVVTSKR